MRQDSPTAHLRRLGFTDPARAHQLIGDHTDLFTPICEALSYSADPDQGLLTMLRLHDTDPDRVATLITNPERLRAVTAIAGMSTALGDMLITHPHWLDTDTPARAEPAQFIEALGLPTQHKPHNDRPHNPMSGDGGQGTTSTSQPTAIATLSADTDTRHSHAGTATTPMDTDPTHIDWDEKVSILRATYYRHLIAIAASDLTSDNPIEKYGETTTAITDLVEAALAGALTLAQAVTPESDTVRFTIIAMGKTGARELNYISDVDVIYVAEPTPGTPEPDALNTATTIATRIAKAVTGPNTEPPLWPLDTALRPEGKDGPLVRTLASHITYYERWAENWEFQALLKARPIAGDAALADDYVTALTPLIWTASARDNFVESSRHMRKRVENTLATKDAHRQIKLGTGGLRDVEFTVQLLQLVHGRIDPTLHVRSTTDALAALKDGGYVGRSHAGELDAHYRFLRTLEHRIQLQKMRRSHVLPEDPIQLRRIARSMKIEGITTGEDLESHWQDVRSRVRDLHQRIYYRPLLPVAAQLSDDEISLDREAASDRLAAIGYRDPARALDHIVALTEGVSRTAKIQRQLLPVLLGWFADGPEPDSGLLHFRILSETMGRTHWYMKLLRDSGMAAQRLAHILSTSRYLAESIPQLPESVAWLEGDEELKPLSVEALHTELDSLISRRTDPREIAMAGRYLRRRMLLRTGLGLVLGVIDAEQARHSITNAADIAVAAALRAAEYQVRRDWGIEESPSRFLIVGLGSCGSREMSFGSDCDLIFVHDPVNNDREAGQKFANQVATATLAMLTEGMEEPPLKADADLRPEGRHGPLNRSLDAYREYYGRWVETWERLALIRARPIAGDSDLGDKFVALIEPLRYGPALADREHKELRRMKARVEAERTPGGAIKTRHLKLGPGGIADVEWSANYLQLDHAGQYPELRTLSTCDALHAAAGAGLIEREEATRLSDAWSYAQQLRLAVVLGTGRTTGTRLDIVPTDSTELANIAALLSHDVTARHEVKETYARLARRARTVVERIFYGP